jgi:predicted nuclease with TOPRIM domain
MPYLTFIKLDPEERDNLLTQEILAKDPLITNRFLATARAHNARAVVAELKEHVHELELENLKLNETIDWMHQTIWDLLRKTRALEHQLEGLEIRRQKNSSQ